MRPLLAAISSHKAGNQAQTCLVSQLGKSRTERWNPCWAGQWASGSASCNVLKPRACQPCVLEPRSAVSKACDLRVESSRACASALCEPAPNTPAPVRSAAALTKGQRHSQRPLAASRTFGGDSLGDHSSCASERRVATRGTSTRQLSLVTCCWRSSSFPKVLACLPGGSEPGCRLKPGVSRNNAAPFSPPCAAVPYWVVGPKDVHLWPR